MSHSSTNSEHGAALERCGLCGGTGRPWHTKRGYDLLACQSCGNAFLSPAQIPADLEALYSEDYFEGGCDTGYPSYLADSRLLAENFRERVDWIESRSPPGRRLLEVGCAYGFFLAAAKERGFDVTGVEISAACAEAATRTLGVNVVQGDFMQVPLEGPYDVIAMFDVIEHMRDPVAVIRRARELLAPGGLLVMETGDLAAPWARALGTRWYFLDPPQHLFYFSASGLEQLVRRVGFTGESSLRRMGRRVSFSNIGFKLSNGVPGARLRLLLGNLSRKNLPGYLYLNFGDAMMLGVKRA